MFRLKLFGAASIEGPQGPVRGRAVQRRRIALMALLALARDRGLTRERLVGYLWPDHDPERARKLLSDSLYRVNQAVDGDAIAAVGDDLRLNPELLPCDAWEFCDAIEQQDWERAAHLHAAPFLDGFYLTDNLELERWVDAQRDRLGRDRARALEELAVAAELQGRQREAASWWRAAANHDPYSSRVALRLVRALDALGERAAALKHANRHADLLRKEIGVSPDQELLAFVQTLSRPTPPKPEGPTVAVLPFATLGPTEPEDYFAEGVTDDLIASLARIGALNVISRASAMRFKDSPSNLREIGSALGATSLVTGTVRHSGDRVRVSVQLVDARTEQAVWAEAYDRELTDVFAIQSEVALCIASALRTRLTADERTRIARPATQSVEAYQHFLQGRYWLSQFTGKSLRGSIQYFQRAIDLDPGYALAHANMAMAYAEMGESSLMAPEEAYDNARAAAATALSLDDSLAEAHCLVAQLRATYDFDWAGAEEGFKRALALSPSSADTFDLYGRMCAAVGRHEEGVAMAKRALELDPLAHRADYATALIRAGRYEQALAAAEGAVEFDPSYARARATLAWALIKVGRTSEGISELETAVGLAPDATSWLGQLGQAHALAGHTDRAREILARLEERSREEGRYVSPYPFAYVWTGLGEHDRALDALEAAWEQRSGAIYAIKGSFLFAPLRRHPRFVALLSRMNLSGEAG